MRKALATASTPIYSRLHQPTVARWEEAVAALEGSAAAVAFASGMAAITAVLLAATARGRHVVAVRPLYGGTDHLLASHLLGFDVSFVRPDGVAAAIRPDTALVLLETPGNPTLDLVDIADVVRQAGGVPVAVDSTFATPVLQRPLHLLVVPSRQGADVHLPQRHRQPGRRLHRREGRLSAVPQRDVGGASSDRHVHHVAVRGPGQRHPRDRHLPHVDQPLPRRFPVRQAPGKPEQQRHEHAERSQASPRLEGPQPRGKLPRRNRRPQANGRRTSSCASPAIQARRRDSRCRT